MFFAAPQHKERAVGVKEWGRLKRDRWKKSYGSQGVVGGLVGIWQSTQTPIHLVCPLSSTVQGDGLAVVAKVRCWGGWKVAEEFQGSQLVIKLWWFLWCLRQLGWKCVFLCMCTTRGGRVLQSGAKTVVGKPTFLIYRNGSTFWETCLLVYWDHW